MKHIYSTVELLESRIAPAQFIVTTLKDITDAAHDTGSLRDAITLANATIGVADTIIFQKSGGTPLKGTIILHSDLPMINDGLTITGPVAGKASGITINGNKHEVLDILQTGGTAFDVTLTDLTVTKGVAAFGGGLYINDPGGNIQVTDCSISGNVAINQYAGYSAGGGGIDLFKGALTISDSKITGNKALGTGFSPNGPGEAYGGGILCGDTLTVQNSVISGNTAKGGNAVKAGYTYEYRSGGAAYGGGIAVYSKASATVMNTQISGNKALAGHSAVGSKGAAGLPGAPGANGGNGGVGSDGGDGGGAYGGGIANYNGTVDVTNSTISGNIVKATNGSKGGVGGSGGAGGHAAAGAHAGAGGNGGDGGNGGYGGYASGGGIDNNGATATVTVHTSTISGNTVTAGQGAAGGPGGVAGGGSYKVGNVVHHGTTGEKGGHGPNSYSLGGGIYSDAALTLSQVTIAKNSAVAGGGVYIYEGTASIHNSTISANKAAGGGGGLLVGTSATVDVISTIIAGNKAPQGADAFGTFTANFDLIQSIDSVTMAVGSGDNITGVSPLLGTLGDHGGPTQTMLPSASSPVIGAGSNPDNLLTDQRGDPRVVGLIDIGAVEIAVA